MKNIIIVIVFVLRIIVGTFLQSTGSAYRWLLYMYSVKSPKGNTVPSNRRWFYNMIYGE